jgi:hypothetical protein
VISLLAVLGAGPAHAGSTARLKPEEPVVAAPAVYSRVQPRLCRDPRSPGLALPDHLPVPDGAPALSLGDAARALRALPLLGTLPADDPRRLLVLSWQAELNAEQQRAYRHEARELEERRCAAEERGDEALAARLLTEQLELERQERRWRQHAIELYRSVVDASQAGALAEQALFALAWLLTLERRGAEARAVAERLLKEHPRSPLLPYAHLLLAESFFDRGAASR